MRLKNSWLFAAFLSMVFIGCHSHSEHASARTSNGKFNEIPVKDSLGQLQYDTTS